MWLLESWWQRAPRCVKYAVSLVALLAIALGGSADHYWT
jgi:hypothetical protein